MFQNIVDMHCHSDNSFDGHHSMIYICEEAVKKNARGIAFTDHCEIDSKDTDFRALTTNAFFECNKAKNSFFGQLVVMQGIELGQSIYNKELSTKILDSLKYDFVLGSIHNLKDMEDFYYLDYKDYDIKKLLNDYFNTELELAQWNNFDSLAHLTYPLRYILPKTDFKFNLSDFKEVVDEILLTLIKNEKALEINTSGLFNELNDTVPSKDIVKRFKELGGELITIGSDSHFAENVCNGISDGMEVAKECGFDSVAIYHGREPSLIPIL